MMNKSIAIAIISCMVFSAAIGFGNSMAIADELSLNIPASAYQGGTFTSYSVRQGETLESIGKKYGFEADLLAAINDIPEKVSPGMKVLIPSNGEVSHRVMEGETIREISELYGISQGQLIIANDLWQPDSLPVGQELYIPGLSVQQVSAQRAATRSSLFEFQVPLIGTLTSPFGKRGISEYHTGIDIAADKGKPVKASEQGEVVFAGRRGNYGRCIIIDHQNGFQTLYAHNDKLLVEEGDWVRKGDRIANVGSTGRSTGPHVHFEIRKAGKVQNPENYIKVRQ